MDRCQKLHTDTTLQIRSSVVPRDPRRMNVPLPQGHTKGAFVLTAGDWTLMRVVSVMAHCGDCTKGLMGNVSYQREV